MFALPGIRINRVRTNESILYCCISLVSYNCFLTKFSAKKCFEKLHHCYRSLRRLSSYTHFSLADDSDKQVEYFFASDASAIIEHTNRVIFLEDDDVSAVEETGTLSIHRMRRDPNATIAPVRAVHTLDMEIMQIMKGINNRFINKSCWIYNSNECVFTSLWGLKLFGYL